MVGIILNDILGDKGQFLSYNQLVAKFSFRPNYIDYYSLLHSIKTAWWSLLRYLDAPSPRPVCNLLSCILLHNKHSNRFVYNNLLSHMDCPQKSLDKWSEKLNNHIPDEKWSFYCSLPFKCSTDTKIRWFQTKIIHRLIPTQYYLSRIDKANSSHCKYCVHNIETIDHLFFFCPSAHALWLVLQDTLRSHNIKYDILNINTILFGGDFNRMLNLIIILFTYYIFKCKIIDTPSCISGCRNFLSDYFNVHRCIFKKNISNDWEKFWQQWYRMLNL